MSFCLIFREQFSTFLNHSIIPFFFLVMYLLNSRYRYNAEIFENCKSLLKIKKIYLSDDFSKID